MMLLKLDKNEVLVRAGAQALLFPYEADPGLLHPLAAGIIIGVVGGGLTLFFGAATLEALFAIGVGDVFGYRLSALRISNTAGTKL